MINLIIQNNISVVIYWINKNNYVNYSLNLAIDMEIY
jgi:hypothetical protein